MVSRYNIRAGAATNELLRKRKREVIQFYLVPKNKAAVVQPTIGEYETRGARREMGR